MSHTPKFDLLKKKNFTFLKFLRIESCGQILTPAPSSGGSDNAKTLKFQLQTNVIHKI